MTAGIAIDNWKLPIFKRRLDEAGYSYTEHPGLTEEGMLLKVTTDNVEALQKVVEAAQLECKNSRLN